MNSKRLLLSWLRPLTLTLLPVVFLTTKLSWAMGGPADTGPQAQAPWKIGDPIVTYWAGPGFPGGGPLDDAAAARLAAGGWNMAWCHENELDAARRHGLRGLLTSGLLRPETLDDPKQKAALDGLIERVRQHPAMYAYHLVDEPSATAFPAIGRLVAYLRERDPAHLAYINLLPIYASNAQLGIPGGATEAYTGHLKQFVETVKPGLLSYDHYQFRHGGTDPNYFLNLALVRTKALESNLPFMNIVQASAWGATPLASPVGPRVPTPDEMRYLVNTTLAYGAQGISYYVYAYPDHQGGMLKADGSPTPLHEVLKTENPQFVRIARALQPLHSLAVLHGGMQPPGTTRLTPGNSGVVTFDPPIPDLPYNAAKGENVQGVILSLFGSGKETGPGNATHFFVMNADSQTPRAAGLRIASPAEIFDAATGQWSPVPDSGKLELALQPGGGKLLRLVPKKP